MGIDVGANQSDNDPTRLDLGGQARVATAFFKSKH